MKKGDKRTVKNAGKADGYYCSFWQGECGHVGGLTRESILWKRVNGAGVEEFDKRDGSGKDSEVCCNGTAKLLVLS